MIDFKKILKKKSAPEPGAGVAKKIRKPRKAQEIFGRVLFNHTWFEQRKDGVYVRRRYGRKWQCVGFDTIRDYAIGQFPLSSTPSPMCAAPSVPPGAEGDGSCIAKASAESTPVEVTPPLFK